MDFDGFLLYLKGDLITEYFHGEIGASVEGTIKIGYGTGCSSLIKGEDEINIYPKNDLESSLKFLNIDENITSKEVNEIIKNRLK